MLKPFAVIPGAQVHRVLSGREKEIVDLVDAAYRLHGEGQTVNPPSYFLRFPDRPRSRIIALPASLSGPAPVDGIKWISSFPDNVERGVPRASAVLILNDPETGYPYACLESSIISAVRTAASAALAADRLSAARGGPRPTRLGIVGTGLIARFVHTYLAGTGWEFDEIGIHDLDPASAAGFRGYLGDGPPVRVYDSAEGLIRGSDLIVFATIAPRPYVDDPGWFAHNPLVLNVSLRDLSPRVVIASANIVDDVEHCLKAETSVHLAEQLTGGREFLDGTLYDVLTGSVTFDTPPAGRPLVFSPFGLGVLDLAVGRHVYDEVERAGDLGVVDGFFHELQRHGNS
jgi:ornithine cyclodeaminase